MTFLVLAHIYGNRSGVTYISVKLFMIYICLQPAVKQKCIEKEKFYPLSKSNAW